MTKTISEVDINYTKIISAGFTALDSLTVISEALEHPAAFDSITKLLLAISEVNGKLDKHRVASGVTALLNSASNDANIEDIEEITNESIQRRLKKEYDKENKT